MKNLIFIFCLFAFIGLQAQTSDIRNNGSSVSFPVFVTIGGGTADTLAKNDTLDLVVRVNALATQRILGYLYVDKVSGTISDTVYLYGSFSSTVGTQTVGIDTIRNSNVSDGWITFTQSRFTTFSYPYLIVRSIAKGGGAKKSIRKIELIGRNN